MLRDVMGEKMLVEETVQGLQLKVVQLEENLSREQERADNAHKTLTSTRAQLTQTKADLARQKVETDELKRKYEDNIRATEVLQKQVGDVISEKEQGINHIVGTEHDVEGPVMDEQVVQTNQFRSLLNFPCTPPNQPRPNNATSLTSNNRPDQRGLAMAEVGAGKPGNNVDITVAMLDSHVLPQEVTSSSKVVDTTPGAARGIVKAPDNPSLDTILRIPSYEMTIQDTEDLTNLENHNQGPSYNKVSTESPSEAIIVKKVANISNKCVSVRPPFKINDWSKWFTKLIFIVLSLASLMRPGWYQDLCVQPPYHDQQQASQCLLYNTSYCRSESSKIYFTLQAQEYEIPSRLSDQIPYTLVKIICFPAL